DHGVNVGRAGEGRGLGPARGRLAGSGRHAGPATGCGSAGTWARRNAGTSRLSSMDASRPARAFVASGVRVSAAAIHPVSTARAADLDEFRGSAPDHIDGLFCLVTSA